MLNIYFIKILNLTFFNFTNGDLKIMIFNEYISRLSIWNFTINKLQNYLLQNILHVELAFVYSLTVY